MDDFTALECEVMRGVAARREVDVQSDAVKSLASRKVISITLGRHIRIYEAGEKWYDANCETHLDVENLPER